VDFEGRSSRHSFRDIKGLQDFRLPNTADPFTMSGYTNTLASSTSRRRNPLSTTISSDWVTVTPTTTRTEPRRSSTQTTTTWSDRTLLRPRTTPQPSSAARPESSSNRSPGRRSDRLRSAGTRANRDLPLSFAHAQVIDLPPSAVVTYIEEPRGSNRSPSPPLVPDRGPFLLRRSPRTCFDDVLAIPPRRKPSTRADIMITFAAPQYNIPSRHSPLPSHTGMCNDSMLIDEAIHTPTPFKGPLHASVKVVLDNASDRLEMIGGARTG
jgi:hypothetical protein